MARWKPRTLESFIFGVLLTLAVGCHHPAPVANGDVPHVLHEEARQVLQDARRNTEAAVEGARVGPLIDINHDAPGHIAELPGVTAAKAKAIVAARPFRQPSELLSRGLVSQGVWDRIAAQVVAR